MVIRQPGNGAIIDDLAGVIAPRCVHDLPHRTAAQITGHHPVDKTLGVRAAIKWPNDVWIGRDKVAGVLLEMAAQGAEDRVALRWDGGSLTYAALQDRARRAAAWVLGQPGDKVVYLGPNHPAFPIALFGAANAFLCRRELRGVLLSEPLDDLVARFTRGVLEANPEVPFTLAWT